jgi:serine/threonine protein kinase
VLTGLAATHAAGLLHRDIKPANIFLVENEDGSESVRLIDFGIAVDQVAVKEEDEEGKVVGTLPYMSVEQLQAEALSPAIDTYALGVVLWRMVVGALPYPELSPMQSAVERVRKGTLPIREVAPEVPTELAEVIDKSLAQDPLDRFPSADAMREALLDIAADLEARSP